jgi:mannose/fructose/N-acetylgalactosamine-specific phosphotransferase system component IIC
VDDLLLLTLLGGLLALDGTSVGQFMVSRPLVAGALTGWAVGDPVTGLLIGGILEVYLISVFPVGGADFPDGGAPTLVAVATGVAVSGPAGVAFGALLGFLLSRLGAYSIRFLRKVNGRLVPDPSRREVTTSRILWAHLGGVSLSFVRGAIMSLIGLVIGLGLADLPGEIWPLQMPGTLILLGIGATVPAGALVGSLGGWRRRGILFGAGLVGFFLAGLIL